MTYSNPANLAVIVCPGCEVFAEEVISHLKKGYRRNFEKSSVELAKRYNLSKDEIVRHINIRVGFIFRCIIVNNDIVLGIIRNFKTPVASWCDF